ncbi:lipase family protein [Rhodococcus phenolicus]|uniref:lipase family protein n=1 Tax=Rhodococcus phenolicus TaxID=263849 RepID=UPI00082E0E49|nr:lipase family protein [Rhodococcus phenolicus]
MPYQYRWKAGAGPNLRVRAVVVAVVACLGSTVVGLTAAPAAAAPVSDFYIPPATFDQAPGAIVKETPTPIFATAPTANGTLPVDGRLVMYTSRTQDGTPVAVSGTYIEPTHPWEGPGERPTVVIAPGTSGQGDHCAISAAFSSGLFADPSKLSISANQEALSAGAWSAAGARVFVTDYIGLGTPGIHTYANRVEQAHAVLDAARAANNLSGSGDATPLLFWGYSQGGGATAAAAEMLPTYAPELNLKGTWAGGPTANLIEILDTIDGALIGGAIGFAINGFIDRNPEIRPLLAPRLTPEGRDLLATLSDSCIGDVIMKHPFLRTAPYTTDGRSLLAHLQEIPEVLSDLNDQRIGTMTPPSPVLITSGRNDDTVPYGQARRLAEDWCSLGATVTFRTNELPPILPGTTLPNHFGPLLIDGYGTDTAVSFLYDRLADAPLSGCAID